MTTGLLATLWQSYLTQVIPKDAPAVQRRETKRAFYAGASSAIQIMQQIAVSDLSETEETARLTDISNELQKYKEDVQAGRE